MAKFFFGILRIIILLITQTGPPPILPHSLPSSPISPIRPISPIPPRTAVSTKGILLNS